MHLPEFLQQGADGEMLLKGHRIGIFHVVHYYNEGYSAEMLACHYPTLPLALIHKAIGFYLDNRADIDAYVAQCRAKLKQQQDASPRRPDMEALRERLEARQRAEAAPSA